MEAWDGATRADAPILYLASGAPPIQARYCSGTFKGASCGPLRPTTVHLMTPGSQLEMIRYSSRRR